MSVWPEASRRARSSFSKLDVSGLAEAPGEVVVAVEEHPGVVDPPRPLRDRGESVGGEGRRGDGPSECEYGEQAAGDDHGAGLVDGFGTDPMVGEQDVLPGVDLRHVTVDAIPPGGDGASHLGRGLVALEAGGHIRGTLGRGAAVGVVAGDATQGPMTPRVALRRHEAEGLESGQLGFSGRSWTGGAGGGGRWHWPHRPNWDAAVQRSRPKGMVRSVRPARAASTWARAGHDTARTRRWGSGHRHPARPRRRSAWSGTRNIQCRPGRQGSPAGVVPVTGCADSCPGVRPSASSSGEMGQAMLERGRRPSGRGR